VTSSTGTSCLTGDGSTAAVRVFALDASPQLEEDASLYAFNDGVCIADGLVGAQTANTTHEIDASTLVGGTTQREVVGGNFSVDVVARDDGSLTLLGVVDTKRGVPCVAEVDITLHDDIAGCIPLPVAYALDQRFADAARTVRAGYIQTGCQPASVITYDASICSAQFALFEAGASQAISDSYVASAATCSMDTSGALDADTLYTLGAPIGSRATRSAPTRCSTWGIRDRVRRRCLRWRPSWNRRRAG
jgi:hypothetical protein